MTKLFDVEPRHEIRFRIGFWKVLPSSVEIARAVKVAHDESFSPAPGLPTFQPLESQAVCQTDQVVAKE